MSKILICGDSFAVDYEKIIGNPAGWASQLAKDHTIVNHAQAGVCEYKILKQLERENLNDFDVIIVSHTSPNRVYIPQHPMYKENAVHKHTDLIYNDVLHHLESNPDNKTLVAARGYFETIYDQQHQEDMYFLTVDRIQQMLQGHLNLHLLTLFDKRIEEFKNHFNLYKMFTVAPGKPNHYDTFDNDMVYKLVSKWVAENV